MRVGKFLKLGLNLGLGLALVGGGCSSEGAGGTDDGTTGTATDEALSTSYGAETATDEAPSFGDPAFTDGDLALTNPAMADPTTALPELANVARIRLFVAWGFLKPRPDATDVVDWSGSISVDKGAVRIVREVRFEAHDMIVRPRPDVQSFDFESHTRPAMDGLVLEVLFPTNSTTNLTFTSAPITTTVALSPGERLSEKLPVDAAGHVLAFHTVRPDASSCREGFLRGHWESLAKIAGREVGIFRGHFLSGTGDVDGTVKGIFGVRADGKKLFFGKIIGTDGKFHALLAGSYGDDDFHGRIILAGHVIDGVVHGKIDKDDDGPPADGGFLGRWSQKCNEDANEGDAMSSDEEDPPSAN